MELLQRINEAHKDVDLYALGERIAAARKEANDKAVAEGKGLQQRKTAMNAAQDFVMLDYRIDDTAQDVSSRNALAKLAIETYENIKFG